MPDETVKKKLRFLKRTKLHGTGEIKDAGEVHDFEGHPDVLDALLRGPEPCAEVLSLSDMAAIKRAGDKAAARAKAKKAAEEE